MKFLVSLFWLQFAAIIASDNNKNEEVGAGCTDVARDDETLLVYSTLGGGLTAVDPVTSEIRWQIEDEPAIKVPSPNEFAIPQYLPDPRDGTLYQLGGVNGGLKKLPYTIPQLVASAPCRSSDGILYSGKKSDTWFLIDPKTGKREKVLGFGSPITKDSIGWATTRSVYLGRTQYTVMMFDSLSTDKNSIPWNVTFYDYSSISMAPELYQNYEWLHLSSSASGLTVTLDRNKGTLLWQKDLKTPIISVFLLSAEGLLSVPFTTLSDEALRNVIDYSRDGTKTDFNLFQTLYVGEHTNGLYAIPALVDKNTATISSEPAIKLLGGPLNENDDVGKQNLIYLNNLLSHNKNENNNIIVFGYYQPPAIDSNLKLSIGSSKSNVKDENEDKEENDISNVVTFPIFDDSLVKKNNNGGNKTNPKVIQDVGVQTESDDDRRRPGSNVMIRDIYLKAMYFLNDQENRILKMLLCILIVMIIGLYWYTRKAVRELRQSQSQNNSSSNQIQKTSSGQNGSNSYTDLEDLGDGEYKIGKICFSPNEVIGKGCEGTFVFKGTFEKRNVAVKRLLPDCFTLADREVSLLRESDTHENVVRYFCTEQDRQFRYIAVELCAATLQEYTEGAKSTDLKQFIGELEVLRQATKGLIHLHSLNIVHRDIKPQNVLISFPDANNRVRVMISDFGLCKKLNVGKASFSRRSGVTGTEGWIAPEMIKGQRTTTSVDIFSLGCVFYYVLSRGLHPFGETMKRQANILTNDYNLAYLKQGKSSNCDILAEGLISDMINYNPANRPTASNVRNHPLFWNEERILSFLQDVSDRVEKTKLDFLEPLRNLEKNAKFIVREDWNLHLDYVVTADMKKYRGYQGFSVRDLLRAIRNKKHHYHELEIEIQASLGPLPVEFTRYWLKRFPHLLSHSFHALDICAQERSFKNYYGENYKFTRPDYFNLPGLDESFNKLVSFMKQAKDSPAKNTAKNDAKNEMKRDNKFNNSNSSSSNNNNYNKITRKGAYNFHRNNDSVDSPPSNMDADGFITQRKGKRKIGFAGDGESNGQWKIPED